MYLMFNLEKWRDWWQSEGGDSDERQAIEREVTRAARGVQAVRNMPDVPYGETHKGRIKENGDCQRVEMAKRLKRLKEWGEEDGGN
jgi:hypothetical protein